MSSPTKDRHVGKKLGCRGSPDFIARVDAYAKSQGLDKQSEAVHELIEKGLSNSPEILDYKTCLQRNEIPKYYPKFIDCIEREEDSGRIIKKQRITEEQCRACNTYEHIQCEIQYVSDLLEIGDKLGEKIDRLEAREQELKERIKKLELTESLIKNKIDRIEKLEPENEAFQYLVPKLNERIKNLEERIEAMENEKLWRKSAEPRQEIRGQSQKLEESRRITERVVEEKKTTEKFLPAQPQESEIASGLVFCPEIKERVSVVHICEKKCDNRIVCPLYLEILKNRALRIQ